MEKSKVEALRRRVDTERAAKKSGRVVFSNALKHDVVELLRRAGWGRKRVSRELGLCESVLHRWCKAQRATEAPKFQRVEVTASAEPVKEGIVLEFTNGARVTGLTLQQLAELLGRAS